MSFSEQIKSNRFGCYSRHSTNFEEARGRKRESSALLRQSINNFERSEKNVTKRRNAEWVMEHFSLSHSFWCNFAFIFMALCTSFAKKNISLLIIVYRTRSLLIDSVFIIMWVSLKFEMLFNLIINKIFYNSYISKHWSGSEFRIT